MLASAMCQATCGQPRVARRAWNDWLYERERAPAEIVVDWLREKTKECMDLTTSCACIGCDLGKERRDVARAMRGLHDKGDESANVMTFADIPHRETTSFDMDVTRWQGLAARHAEGRHQAERRDGIAAGSRGGPDDANAGNTTWTATTQTREPRGQHQGDTATMRPAAASAAGAAMSMADRVAAAHAESFLPLTHRDVEGLAAGRWVEQGGAASPSEANGRTVARCSFSDGERVQVWSNSRGAWLDGIVLEAFSVDCEADGYTVSAGTTKVSSAAGVKWVLPGQAAAVLRRPH